MREGERERERERERESRGQTDRHIKKCLETVTHKKMLQKIKR